jgi:hypothetical protein
MTLGLRSLTPCSSRPIALRTFLHQNGRTPLHEAVLNGKVAAVNGHIAAKANVKATDQVSRALADECRVWDEGLIFIVVAREGANHIKRVGTHPCT